MQVPLQVAWPAAQVQVPPLQNWPPLHAMPHLPQLPLDAIRSTQVPLQLVAVAPAHEGEQTKPVPTPPSPSVEAAQVGQAPPHTVVQSPQCAGALRSVSQPSLTFIEQ